MIVRFECRGGWQQTPKDKYLLKSLGATAQSLDEWTPVMTRGWALQGDALCQSGHGSEKRWLIHCTEIPAGYRIYFLVRNCIN